MNRRLWKDGADMGLIEADGTIATEPDRDLVRRMIACETVLIEHSEYDCGGGDGCDTCASAARALREINEEQRRREGERIEVEDPDYPTLEERLGPFGLEWEAEQAEREGRASNVWW